MAKLPLTRPIYMAELGRRMGMPSREARRHLRKVEHARKVRLLFDSRTERQGRLWTTEALLLKHCPELIDRPRRALNEVRAYSSRLTEKVTSVEESVDRLEAELEQGLSEVRATLARLEERATHDTTSHARANPMRAPCALRKGRQGAPGTRA
jgi:chemotaxis response regulator CheB